MKIYCDSMRHLICVPYTVETLHEMAKKLNIKRCWYHASSKYKHYDIPKKRIEEIQNHPEVEVISPIELLSIIKKEINPELEDGD